MNRTLLKASLVKHEGIRRFPYADSAANLTVGVGRNLTANGLREDEIQLMLDNDINAALASPEVRAKLAELGVEARGGSPESARELLASEIRRWSEVITRADIERQ